MNFAQAIVNGFRSYIVFSERACRSELWFWVLFTTSAGVILLILDLALFGQMDDRSSGPLYTLFSLVTLIPNISISVRRLHDLDKSGWWLFLILIPLIGSIVLIIWFIRRGTEGTNRFGPDPLGSGFNRHAASSAASHGDTQPRRQFGRRGVK
ncbi:MAG: DUF805 domain-containing protein [Gammaproteobacteria bacterium]|nr:DUF805 domain-containing protein [Gammaproteobacteria bacterium]